MPKKRRNRGRRLSGAGHEGRVQCSLCGALIPADKAIKETRWVSPVRGQVSFELEKQGTYVSKKPMTKYYCISCAIHRGIVRPRAEEERKLTRMQRTQGGIPLKFLQKRIA